MLELLSPAGSPEAVVAAVQSGADAVYMGFGGFNARRGAKNFTDEEFAAAVEYCRVRGCKVYVTLNTLVSDRELPEALKLATRASDLGADAIIVQDLGLAAALHQALPDIKLHASTQMSVHNLAGVQAAAEMGITRVVLARELSSSQIAHIAANAPIEVEVFVHGALCMCHSGQCYMSALIGRRSGNRGMCAQPCRMEYSVGGRMDDHPLSLKDNCLVQYLDELDKAGVACVKIEGRMKRPEYVGMVTSIYSHAIRDGKAPTETEMQQLEEIFSRQGFTQGYYKGEKGRDMFGMRSEGEKAATKLLADTRRSYMGTELRRVPVQFYAIVHNGVPVEAAAQDDRGNRAVAWGEVPQAAQHQELTGNALSEQLYKTGGTPFYCAGVSSDIHPGLFLPAAAINELRRQLLAELTAKRAAPPERRTFSAPLPSAETSRGTTPELCFQIISAEQLSPDLAALRPVRLYVPLELLAANPDALAPFVAESTTIAAVLPRVITGDEETQVLALLEKCRAFGVREALVGNLGHVQLARRAGMELRGDFGLNCFNSYTLDVLRRAGFLSATASFELRLSQIRDLRMSLPVELIAYGRLPLMIMDNCIIKNSFGHCSCANQQNMLSDRRGAQFPILREFGCRNQIFNADKLFLADKPEIFTETGLSAARLFFTTESARECVEIAKRYLGQSDYQPNGLTRGLYFRGVE